MPAGDRVPSLLALAIPVLTGAAWMALAGAPASWPLVNIGALVLAGLWVMIGQGPHTSSSRHILALAMLAAMLAAVWVGPVVQSADGHAVRRWFPLGSLAIHTGMLTVPAFAMLAARNRPLAPFLLLAPLLAAWLQPDAATGFALTFAGVGIYHVTKDWRVGAVCALGFFASIAMALRGEVPVTPFVERVVVDTLFANVLAALALAAALVASFVLLLNAIPFDRTKRFALAGTLFGFTVASLMSTYPTPLIGYGAAPILGFGLALGLHGIPQR
ncbi:hypothetical protein [Aurantiacibacter spongiae]|uniref:Uncharacterized protein n=1 Tax=Aurantiacibacter spongiae TaxID=2488860 RepID=A0A3N5CVM8_9SPHN|nr:hypothetical protein [Aurantiacibacter spongiae]RPF70699.1 hypothetical protein EG799_02995 [Aurantiacibacter spongiae]